MQRKRKETNSNNIWTNQDLVHSTGYFFIPHYYIPGDEEEVVTEVVVTVTTPPPLLELWAMAGLPGMMIDVRVGPV